MTDNVCLSKGCAACCYETEMIISEGDAARLAAKGHAREAFSFVDADGYLTLKNVETNGKKHCFFLKEDRCTVYADRPEGCRWYPIVLSDGAKVVRDVDCPHRQAFAIPPASERKLLKIVAVIQREAQKR